MVGICVVAFVLTSLYFVVLSKAVADYRFFVGDKLRFSSFGDSLAGLLGGGKQTGVFLFFELCVSAMILIFSINYILQPEKFKSDTVEITPNIRIPAPAGQGQFGSSWFASEKDKKKMFKHNVVDFNNPKIKELIDTGDIDIRDRMKKLNEGVSINIIEREIKEERLNKQKESEELNNKKEFEDIDKVDDYDFDRAEMEFEQNIEMGLASFLDDNDNVNLEDFNCIEEYNQMFIDKTFAEIKNKESENLKKEKPYDPKEDKNKIFKSGGLITGYYTHSNSETISYIDSDTHSVILGATRSGKSRCVVMQSVMNTALAGESMVVTDPKGELYAYTSGLVRKLGYEVICLDFKNPNQSSKYNILQPIINAKNDRTEEHPNGDIDLVVKYAQELSNMLIKETKGENPMWTNNAKAMITGAILTTVLENKDEASQNMANVYRFLNDGEGNTISQFKDNLYLYIEALRSVNPENPIINSLLGIINTPKETRGGFATNASAALNLYSQPSMWQITHRSNVDLSKMGERKQILYFILPDQDTSYYQIVSIIVKQMYNELVKVSDRYGGRLPIRVNFFLDEFGNFAKMPDLATMLTVAGGRGMRFNLFLQGFPQITQKYDRETTEIVKSNCETWVYLKAMDTTTREEISKKLGSYTIYSNSESMSQQGTVSTSSSSSQSLQKRSLLLPEEVEKINRPYLLVMYGNNPPAVNIAPDISKLSVNKMYGMGNEEYNNRLRMIRDRQRTITKDNEKPVYWDVFTKIKEYCNAHINPYQSLDGTPLEEPRPISPSEHIACIAQYIQNEYEFN